jgi:hypothetical protein
MTGDEHQRCQKLVWARISRDLRSAWYLPWLASTIFVLLVLAYSAGRGLIDERAFMIALLAYLWGNYTTEVRLWLVRRKYWAIVMADGRLPDEVRLKIDGDGLESQTTKYAWRAFSDISEHAEFILLWFSKARYFPVPVRAFTSQDARRDFVNLARERIGWLE